MTPTQRRQNLATLRAEHLALLKQEKIAAFANRPPCPYCGHKHVYSYGKNLHNTHRFKCSSCKKSFSARTGTCLHYIHLRGKFERYMHSMLTHGHRTLKEMCAEFGISMLTAFDWRHKILASLNCSPKQFSGLIELRNSTMGFSRKGIKVSKNADKNPQSTSVPVQLLILADYNNNAGVDIARIGQLKVSDVQARLAGRLDKNHVVITHYNPIIQQFGRVDNVAFSLFSKNQNPNKLDDREAFAIDKTLRQLVYEKARGVSTKYLHHYAWWILQTLCSKTLESQLAYKTLSKANPLSWAEYTNMENRYQQFMQKHSDEPHLRTSHRHWKTANWFRESF